MRKILICCLVALFLPFLMTTNTKAEEINNLNNEILDYSEVSKLGEGSVELRSISFPDEGDASLFTAFKTLLPRFNFIKEAPTETEIIEGTGNNANLSTLQRRTVALLAYIVIPSVGLVFFWWGLRKTVSAIMSAFKKGKLRI